MRNALIVEQNIKKLKWKKLQKGIYALIVGEIKKMEIPTDDLTNFGYRELDNQ